MPHHSFGQHFDIVVFFSKSTSSKPISQVISMLSPLLCCLTDGGTLCNTDESPEPVVYPVEGKEKAGGPPPLSLDTLTHTCLTPFSPNWGKFQTNLLRLSHPVLPSLHPEQARRREKKKESGLGADLKTTPCGCSPRLKDTRPHYQIFTKKLSPITVQREAFLVRKGL